ncbi:membrane protein [Gordoniibacillus kamchatkensis]|uniref:Membrane protein n=1 Tax=Gordoniibacillus kamchatkensis TaxID=1590651 RepID=A0ABR5AE32_9BACL|nr:RnfABCDGE type electron transport complex subunit D [Paenibacillus sp. VKM B-2647]KIL38958.1 membrane protein [Paenibacillus sp. VKM B-2647]
MTAGQWIKSPKGYVTVALAACLLIASIGAFDAKGIINGVVAVAVSVAADIVCALIGKRKRIMPDGAVITGLINALVLSVTTSLFIVAATCIVSILSKHLLVAKKKPVFNPAAFGLLLSVPLFHSGQSWWGAFGDLPAWTIALLLLGGYAVVNRVNKYPQLFAFIGTFLFLLFMMGCFHVGDAADALRPPFINAALFFAFFMLTDPPTSPAKTGGQIAFGILAAVVSAAVYACFGGLMYLFIGLLAGNLYHLLKARLSTGKEYRRGA